MSDLEQLARTLAAQGHQLQYEEDYLKESGRWKLIGEKLWHYPLCKRCVEMKYENQT